MEEKFIPKDIGDYKAETASGRESLDNSFNLEILPFLKEGNINAFADLGDVKEKIRRLVEKPFIDKLTGKAIYEAKKYIMRKDNKGELHTSFSFKKKYLINNVMRSSVFLLRLNFKSMARLIFSEITFGFRIAEYPNMTSFFSSLASLCLIALSVIV